MTHGSSSEGSNPQILLFDRHLTSEYKFSSNTCLVCLFISDTSYRHITQYKHRKLDNSSSMKASMTTKGQQQMDIFETLVSFIQWLSPYFSWIVRGTQRIMADSTNGEERNGARANGEEKNGARAKVTTNVVGKDSDGHTKTVNAVGAEVGEKPLSEAVGDIDVEVNVKGITGNGTADVVNTVGLKFK